MYRDASMDILATEPYIRKMFKAVHSLVLKEEPAKPVLVGDNHPPPRYNPLVVGFKSVDGEYVKFHRVMKARGQVEEWIKFLDHYIKTTLINLCRELKAKARLKNKNFEDILEDHRYPFQVLFHASAKMKLSYQVTTIVAHFLWCEEMSSLNQKGVTGVIIDVHNMKKRLAK